MLGQLYYAVLKATSHSSQQLNHLHTYDDVSSVSNMYRDTAVSVDTNLKVESIQHSSQVSANLRIHMDSSFYMFLHVCSVHCSLLFAYRLHLFYISASSESSELWTMQHGHPSQTNPKVWHVSKISLVLSSDLMPWFDWTGHTCHPHTTSTTWHWILFEVLKFSGLSMSPQ